MTGLLVGGVAGWGVDQVLGNALGAWGMLVSMSLSTIVFYVTRRWMISLRDG